MKFSILAVLAFLCLATAASAETTKTQNPNQKMYGASHNNYHGTASSYGPSHNNYNGKETYSGAPQYTNHPADYSTSRQALDTSVPY